MAIESRTPSTDADGVSRRLVLRTAAVAGVAAAGVGLAACGSSDSSSGDSSAGGGSSQTADTGASTPADTGGGAAGGIAQTADIPVKGGKVVDAGGKKIVVTQPAQGDFKAFSAICTHQGCTVNQVTNNVIMCPCHGSQYSAEDGSVKGGPAPKALAPVSVKVSGDSIVQG
jgi:Rieske Fe-S protein